MKRRLFLIVFLSLVILMNSACSSDDETEKEESLEEKIDSLIIQLSDENWEIRLQAAEELGIIGESAQKAVPTLIVLLHDENEAVRRSASQALGLIMSKEIISEKDGAKMRLIPAGEFQMGHNLFGDNIQAVYVDIFYIDLYEVTNAQYQKFADATGHHEPKGVSFFDGSFQEGFEPWKDPNFNKPNQPVVCVGWEDAAAYAKWAGKRLPTEAEWEKAARGGLNGKLYVWGDAFPPPKGTGNFPDKTAKKIFPDWIVPRDYDDGYIYPSPVGSFRPNGYNLSDMAGNVQEWCADAPREDDFHVVRGGMWFGEGRPVQELLVGNPGRFSVKHKSAKIFYLGFRCARSITP